MKEIKAFFCFLCFILVPVRLFPDESVQPVHGTALCRKTAAFLASLGYEPQKAALVPSSRNDFPFNITVTIPPAVSARAVTPDSRNTLIAAFQMEDVLSRPDFFTGLLDACRHLNNDYTLILLFSYGDTQTTVSRNLIRGTDAFTGSIDSPDSCTAVCFTFSAENKVVIIPGGSREIAPSWLLKRIANSCISCRLAFRLLGGGLGFLYRLGILKSDERCSSFLVKSIPCCSIYLPYQADTKSSYTEFIASFFKAYTVNGTEIWDHHYITFHINGTLIWINEQSIIICFIVISFISLFILSELSFIPNKRRLQIRHDVFRLWYILPVTALSTVLSFQTSQFFYTPLQQQFSFGVLPQFLIKTIFTFIIITFLFLFIVKRQGILEERAYAYLLTLDSVINIFIFSAVDISLFFLFTAEYFIIYLFRPFKKTIMLSIAFIAMLIPYAPYFIQISGYLNPSVSQSAVRSSLSGNIFLSLCFLPFLFQWFRIITRLNDRWNYKQTAARTRRLLSATAFLAAVTVISAIIVSGMRLIPALSSQGIIRAAPEKKTNTIIGKAAYDDIVCTYKDKTFFGDTNRTITVDLGHEAEKCIITVSGTSANSVLYSDDIYESDKKNRTDTFIAPQWPPETMTFSYMADTSIPSVVSVSAFYPSGKKGEYVLSTHTLSIPALSARKTGSL